MNTTVITATYNGAAWIEETLDSVAKQTRPAAAHWVVDDGSTDDSVNLARRYRGTTVARNPAKGPNAARAFAVDQAKSKFVAILDQDDLWHPAHLALLEDALDSDPAAPAAFAGAHRFYDGQSIPYQTEQTTPARFDPWEKFPISTIAAPAQVLVRRDALAAIGGWPRHIVGVADFFTWLLLSAQTPLLVLPALTVGYRQHEQSYSMALRQEHRKKFFDRYFQAATAALERRREISPDGATGSTRQLSLFQLMSAWLETSDSASKSRRSAIAISLDEEIGRHSPEFVIELWGQVFYFSAPIASLRRPLWLLNHYIHIPSNAQNLRRSIRRVISRNLQFASKRFFG